MDMTGEMSIFLTLDKIVRICAIYLSFKSRNPRRLKYTLCFNFERGGPAFLKETMAFSPENRTCSCPAPRCLPNSDRQQWFELMAWSGDCSDRASGRAKRRPQPAEPILIKQSPSLMGETSIWQTFQAFDSSEETIGNFA
jgi:hypothetical protein